MSDALACNTFLEPDEPAERDERDGQLGHKYSRLETSGWFRVGSPAVSDPVDIGRNRLVPAAPAFTFLEPDERDERDGQLGYKYIAS
eukprot:453551-Prymnesium_polylepis.1